MSNPQQPKPVHTLDLDPSHLPRFLLGDHNINDIHPYLLHLHYPRFITRVELGHTLEPGAVGAYTFSPYFIDPVPSSFHLDHQALMPIYTAALDYFHQQNQSQSDPTLPLFSENPIIKPITWFKTLNDKGLHNGLPHSLPDFYVLDHFPEDEISEGRTFILHLAYPRMLVEVHSQDTSNNVTRSSTLQIITGDPATPDIHPLHTIFQATQKAAFAFYKQLEDQSTPED